MPKEPIIVVENANSTAVPWSRNLADSTVQEALILCGLSSDPQHNRSINLLDFGCGFGRYLELFQDFIPPENLVGIESCQDSIAQVRAKGFRCLEADSEIPFEDGHFDVVFSSNVVEHIPRPKYLKYLEEIERVLRPGGRFVVGTPNYPWKRLYDLRKALVTRLYRYYLLDDPTHCNKLSFSQLEQDLSRHFKNVRLQPTYIWGEKRFSKLRDNVMRHRLRYYSDKISGYCIK